MLTIAHAKDTLSLGTEVKSYDVIFDKIAEKRVGLPASAIDAVANPFVVIYEASSKGDGSQPQKPLYELEATLNHKAKINGTWYSLNDKLDSLKLVSIKYNRVVLQNDIEKKEIFIRTKDASNIKILSK